VIAAETVATTVVANDDRSMAHLNIGASPAQWKPRCAAGSACEAAEREVTVIGVDSRAIGLVGELAVFSAADHPLSIC